MNNYLSKVGILLVVTNEAEFLPLLCNSIVNQNYKNIKLFVLDNNCEDNSVEIIKSFFPDSFILQVKRNAGFARGNNLLAEEAIKSGCELLFTLNPDIELHENCISSLVKLISTDKKIAAVAPIMFFGREDKYLNKIQFYAFKIDFITRNLLSLHTNQIFIEGKFPKEIEVNVVGGGITFIRASVVKEIGLFDERYYIYGEEVDLGLRSFRAGYKMIVTSEAKVWHHHDWSRKNNKQHYFSYFYINRAKILYFIKYSLYKSLIILLFKELLLFPVKVRWSLKTADLKLLKYYYLGFLHGTLNKQNKSNVRFESNTKENKIIKETILTVDYELFLGMKTGSVSECLIEPTQKLASILEKNGSRMTIFWDILHYYRLLELENGYPELKQDRLLIEEQILDLVRRGHDIQLHLHTFWLDAKYENNKWNFNYDRFKLHSLSDENNPKDINTILGCVTISKKMLEETIKIVKPDYKVTTFRAGGYLIEPFDKIKDAFLKNEVKVDSSVCPQLFYDNRIFSFDFRFYPDKPKYNFELTPKDIVKAGNFIEIPITTVKIQVFTHIFLTFIRIIKYPYFESERKGISVNESFEPNRILDYKKLRSFTHFKNCQLTTDNNYKERFSYIFKKVPDYSTMILHPKLLNSHTLGIIDEYVSTNKVRFISIQDFLSLKEE
jgi:GT2 family glycosyltransferase